MSFATTRFLGRRLSLRLAFVVLCIGALTLGSDRLWAVTRVIYVDLLRVDSTTSNALDVAGGIQAGSGNVGIINTSGKIPAISTAYFSDASLPASSLPALTGDVTSSAGSSVTNIAADVVGSAEIAADTVGQSELAANSVAASEIEVDAVGSSEIAADAVGSSEIATDAVGSAEIAASAVGAGEISDGSIANADVSVSAAIAYSKLNLATSIVNADVSSSAAIAYSKLNLLTSILNADISATAAIVYSKLAFSNNIVAGDIAADAVGTSEIATDGVGSAEIAASAVGTSEIADGTVAEADLAAAVVSAFAKLADSETVTGAWEFSNTAGLIVDQGAGDTENYTMQSSDVAHGMTGIVTTDTFGVFRKHSNTTGGASLQGYSEDNIGVSMFGTYTNGDTAKDNTASAGVVIGATKKSGTSDTAPAANENLLVIRAGTSATTGKFVFDSDGDAYADVQWTTFDGEDDLALLESIELAYGGKVTTRLGGWMQEHRETLAREQIVSFDAQGKPQMVNLTRLAMLQAGAVRQVGAELKTLRAEMKQLKAAAARGQRPSYELWALLGLAAIVIVRR